MCSHGGKGDAVSLQMDMYEGADCVGFIMVRNQLYFTYTTKG
jgi:hypothetical protein